MRRCDRMKTFLKCRQIRVHRRTQRRVDTRRAGALVLAELWQDLAAEAHAEPGGSTARCDELLVRGIDEAEQQADGDVAQARVANPLDELIDLRNIEWFGHIARRADPLAHSEPMLRAGDR